MTDILSLSGLTNTQCKFKKIHITRKYVSTVKRMGTRIAIVTLTNLYCHDKQQSRRSEDSDINP